MNRLLALLLFINAAVVCHAQNLPPGAANQPAVYKGLPIYMIATDPLITDMRNGLTPSHLRAAVKFANKADRIPIVIAANAPADRVDWQLTSGFDVRWVIVPLSDDMQVRLFPVGRSADPEAEWELMVSKLPEETQKKLAKIRKQHQQKLVGAEPTFEQLNSADMLRLWLDYFETLQRTLGKPTPWHKAAKRTAESIVASAELQPLRRVVFIADPATLCLVGQHLLERDAPMKTIADLPPITRDDLLKNFTKSDMLHALRPLTQPKPSKATLDKMEKILQQIAGVEGLEGDHLLMKGRLLLHRRKLAAALERFQQLSTADAKIISQYDGITPLYEAGLLMTAVTQLKMRRFLDAQKTLSSMLKNPDLTMNTRIEVLRIDKIINPEKYRPKNLIPKKPTTQPAG